MQPLTPLPTLGQSGGLEPSQPPTLAATVTVKLHGQVVVSQVCEVSPEHPSRAGAWLSFGIPGCCSSTNDICKFSKCLWTMNAQKENRVFHQSGKQILGLPLVFATEQGCV